MFVTQVSSGPPPERLVGEDATVSAEVPDAPLTGCTSNARVPTLPAECERRDGPDGLAGFYVDDDGSLMLNGEKIGELAEIDNDTPYDCSAVLSGSVLLLAAGFAPFTLLRLFPLLELSVLAGAAERPSRKLVALRSTYLRCLVFVKVSARHSAETIRVPYRTGLMVWRRRFWANRRR